MSKIKILIVDDHPIVRDGLISFLKEKDNFSIVGVASDGQEAVDKVNEYLPDVVLMDIGMPVMNGIDATQIITKKHPGIKVLILTVHNEKGYILKIMKSGARGYILKDIGSNELINSIESVYKGEIVIDPNVSQIVLDDYVQATSGKGKTPKEDLSKRETEILKMIVEGISNKEIADKLFLSVNTIKAHRENIMKKLNIRNMAGLTKYAIDSKIIDL
jgi:two-component system, NarL family, nitrate/nitrite response regulator NarL